MLYITYEDPSALISYVDQSWYTPERPLFFEKIITKCDAPIKIKKKPTKSEIKRL